jgi:hypothetical protein
MQLPRSLTAADAKAGHIFVSQAFTVVGAN